MKVCEKEKGREEEDEWWKGGKSESVEAERRRFQLT